MIKDSCDFMRLMSEPVEVKWENVILMCYCCQEREALKKLNTDTGYWFCYGCYIAYLEVIPDIIGNI